MPDLISELQLRYGVTAPEATFALEVSDLDGYLDRAIQVNSFLNFNWYWSDEQLLDYYKDQNILEVTDNGYSHIRLYAPDNVEASLFATEIPVAIKGNPGFDFNSLVPPVQPGSFGGFYINAGSFGNAPQKLPPNIIGKIQPRQVPPAVEFVGKRQSLVYDTIRFSNSRTAALKYNYVKTGFEVAYASTFRTADGRIIDPPVWVPELNGLFVLKEPASGVMVVRYLAPYRLYKVNYGMPSGIEYPYVQLAWLKGDITQFPMPPVRIFAVALTGGQVSEVEVEKKVFPQGADLASWSFTGFDDAQENPADRLTEKSRITETVRIEDPEDPEVFVDVQRAKEVTLFDNYGRAHVFRLKP